MVTRTAYDSLGRATDVTVDAVAGAGTSGTATNLLTHTTYDNLGDKLSVTDPKGVKTSYTYDRIGDPVSTIQGDDGGTWSSSAPDHDVKSTFAYDALGELIGYCPARNMVSGLTCTVTTTSDANAWHYGFDAAGHQVSVTAPVASGLSPANRLDVTSTTYDAGGRVTQVCSYPTSASSCSGADRYTTTGYDAQGRPTLVQTYSGAPGSGTLRLKWTTTYQGDGYPTSVAFDGTGSSPSESTDTLTYTPDSLDRTTAIKRGGTALTSYVYNPDDTASSRTDTSTFVTNLGYDWAGRPTSVSSSSIDSGAAATFAYRNDGLLDSRAWSGTNATAAASYDAAKRPTQLAISGSGVASATVSQTYDRNGNVATEGRSFAGISGAPGTGTATFANDQLNRVTADAISGGNSYAYAYDPDGNRTSVTINAGTPTVSTYDATDQLLTQGPSGGTLLSFNYDPYGNMTTSAETFNSGTTVYTYDYGDRLTKVTPPAGLSGADTYTLDALGRIGSETVGATTTTLSYVGTSKTVSRLATGATNVDSLIGSDGARLATVSGSAFGWLLPDLHGDIAGASSSTLATITDALRYDAFGTLAASTTSSLPTPWRYQGELLVNPAGASDLYADGARFYAPGLGVFTQLDTSQGGALDPLSMNRFLYAAADPETLIDPSGHRYCTTQNADNCDAYRPGTTATQQQAIADSYAKKQAKKVAVSPALARPVGISSLWPQAEPLHCYQTKCSSLVDKFADMFPGTDPNQLALSFMYGAASGFAIAFICGITAGVGCLVLGAISLSGLAAASATGHGPKTAYDWAALAGGFVGGAAGGGLADAPIVDDPAIGSAFGRLPQDVAIDNKITPGNLGTIGRTASQNADQNAVIQAHIVDLINEGAEDIRMNQQQVNAAGARVGINRPDLQYTLNGVRYYEEYETSGMDAALDHMPRIVANDSTGVFLANPGYVP
jgi:RHS repeat-associated protein